MKKALKIFLFVLLLAGIGAGTVVLISKTTEKTQVASTTTEGGGSNGGNTDPGTDEPVEIDDSEITVEVDEITF